MRKKIIAALALAALTMSLTGCASWDRFVVDLQSDMNDGLDRTVNVYTANGELLATYKGKIGKRVIHTKEQMEEIELAVKVYKEKCIQSGKPEQERKYNVIHALYIGEEQMTLDDIAEREHVDTRTIYRDRDEGIEKITALLFGIDGINRYVAQKSKKNCRKKK